MKLFSQLSLLFLLSLGGHASASTEAQQYTGDPDAGAIYPSTLNITSGETDGAQFVSAVTTIGESVASDRATKRIEVDNDAFTWSYNRGLGSVADACPSGYTAGLGGCWEDCPAGYSNMGTVCTSWSTMQTIGTEVIAASCPDGEVNEGGLCYEPCEEGFSGVGALCFGRFDGATTSNRIAAQANQQQAARSTSNSGGILLSEDNAPDIRTTVLISTSMCEMESVAKTFGLMSDPVAWLQDTINEEVNSALEPANTSLTIPTGTAWFAPSIESVVLFDLSMDITCEDNGTLSTAMLDIDPSISVQLDTRMFDNTLSNLSGVDIGILNLSIYELIPFRLYGAVGTTLSVPVHLYTELDRSLPALYLDNTQLASTTDIAVTPALDLWLSVDAYLRIPSFVDFIPDILQLGTEFYLTVLDEELSYMKSGSLRLSSGGGYEIHNAESLTSDFSAGSGYVDFYLRILGQDVDGFGDDVDLSWVGYEQYDVFIDQESTTPVKL
jgi:hypothetical protein